MKVQRATAGTRLDRRAPTGGIDRGAWEAVTVAGAGRLQQPLAWTRDAKPGQAPEAERHEPACGQTDPV